MRGIDEMICAVQQDTGTALEKFYRLSRLPEDRVAGRTVVRTAEPRTRLERCGGAEVIRYTM